ncbi:hypothetical protein IEQ34_024216 [Dendrobium chrysotoxum]|uniref:Uncharacterized protein n=1 Tax=Dendrobium chrysotoxum TaxID=161865 RepID=A0AAV7FT57_DENCH|nr:hypothetical protein IEQ34_024216 [Dendrobium chrysotoxum]
MNGHLWLILLKDKPVALSIVQARLVGLAHFSVGYIFTYAAFLIASTSGKFEISKVPSLREQWKIHGKLQSPPRNSAPIRLHRRCFFTGRPRANYRSRLWTIWTHTSRNGSCMFVTRRNKIKLVRRKSCFLFV